MNIRDIFNFIASPLYVVRGQRLNGLKIALRVLDKFSDTGPSSC